MGFDPISLAAIAGTVTAGAAAKTAFASKPKAAPVQAPTAEEPAEIPKGDDEEKKKRAILAKNIGAEAPQTQKLGGKPASVTRRTLLGL